MGETKNNLKATKPDTQGWFDGVKDLVRPKDAGKKSAHTYVDLLAELEKKNNELVSLKKRDLDKEPERYSYNLKVLTELEVQSTYIQLLIESTARAAEIADRDGKKN